MIEIFIFTFIVMLSLAASLGIKIYSDTKRKPAGCINSAGTESAVCPGGCSCASVPAEIPDPSSVGGKPNV